ncbi:protein terminal ear1 homolog [Durio zibethinus]|uniref:Protein terminal ear1 homolog n=1 Tax=Durio zibethinus TaxID=66656 RepID=A0A6P6AB38_DURZI|nr:protein terminal ear1 homolog [Durio zibethinus]
MVLEEAQEPRVVARKESVVGTRRRNRDKWGRNKRYGNEGLVRFDHSTQARKKEWRAKPNSWSSGDNKHFSRNADQASFESPEKVQGRAAGNNNREKHPLIPLKDDGMETTVMIKNIPNRYTREMLKDFLDQHCMLMNKKAEFQNAGADEEPSLSAFDFLYLPIDFGTKSNKGYAFVNFTNPGAARKFFDAWHNKHWDCFQSNKIREIYCAKLQGMEQLVKHFERMEFPFEDFHPLAFSPARDGSKQLVKETIVGRCTGSNCTKPNLSSW